jgi:hypothetical protein
MTARLDAFDAAFRLFLGFAAGGSLGLSGPAATR